MVSPRGGGGGVASAVIVTGEEVATTVRTPFTVCRACTVTVCLPEVRPRTATEPVRALPEGVARTTPSTRTRTAESAVSFHDAVVEAPPLAPGAGAMSAGAGVAASDVVGSTVARAPSAETEVTVRVRPAPGTAHDRPTGNDTALSAGVVGCPSSSRV